VGQNEVSGTRVTPSHHPGGVVPGRKFVSMYQHCDRGPTPRENRFSTKNELQKMGGEAEENHGRGKFPITTRG